jgi:hypothetical protein
MTKARRDVGGLWLVCSDDGFRWRSHLDRPVIPGWPDTFTNFFFDQRISRWVLYTRPSIVAGPPRAIRMIARRESDDLIHWDEEQIVLDTDDRDAPAVGTVVETPGVPPRGRDRQFYGMTVTPWHGIYLGFAAMYDVVLGNMWCELVHSFDGIAWRREPTREPFIRLGQAGAWDSGMISYIPAGCPVAMGDDLYVYYEGMNYTHHEALDRHGKPDAVRGLGAVRLPFGRLVGYVSDEVRGALLTNTFYLDELPLHINADAADGSLLCSICTAAGKPMPGYTEAEAQPIRGFDGWAEVQYTGKNSLDELVGERVRLRISVKRAAVYGFSTGRSEPEA